MNIKAINRRIHDYLDNTSKETGLSKTWLYVDCVLNCMVRKLSIRDYFIFKFYYLNRNGKRSYLSGLEQNRWQDEHNDKKMEAILVDKEKSLNHFDKVIEREWCGIKYHSSLEEYESFVKKHEKAIFKPLSLCGGKGIQILKLSEIRGGYMSTAVLTIF